MKFKVKPFKGGVSVGVVKIKIRTKMFTERSKCRMMTRVGAFESLYLLDYPEYLLYGPTTPRKLSTSI